MFTECNVYQALHSSLKGRTRDLKNYTL